MKISGLWRYPVRSMLGERQATLEFIETGVQGDRRFAVLDMQTGTFISAKRDARLLQARALLAGVTLTMRLPTGETALGTGPMVDLALSDWLGQPVRLMQVTTEVRETDLDVRPVHILTTASVRAVTAERPDLQWDLARFRPNVLIDVEGDVPVEQDWMGRRLTIGDVELEIYQACDRCVMTTQPQLGGIEHQTDILRHLTANHGSNLGVLARVVRGGRIETGQAVA